MIVSAEPLVPNDGVAHHDVDDGQNKTGRNCKHFRRPIFKKTAIQGLFDLIREPCTVKRNIFRCQIHLIATGNWFFFN